MSTEISQQRKRSLEKPPIEESGLLLGGGSGPNALGPLQGMDPRMLPTGFERWRSELDQLSGMKLLDAMTEPLNAAACVQTLPAEDLHRYLYEIGLEDAEAVLALANGEQVKTLLDFEVWERSDILPKRLDAWLFALMRAGKDILYQRVLELDDSLLGWIVKSNAYAFVIDDPDDFDPPDAEHFLTPDRRLCVVFPRSVDHLIDTESLSKDTTVNMELDQANLLQNDSAHDLVMQKKQAMAQAIPLEGGAKDAPARLFIDMLMQEQPELCIHLLLASTAALNTQLTEDAYRWRQARMADLGFVDYYEAREIYTPPPHDWKRSLPAQRVDEEQAPAKKSLANIVATNLRLDKAFALLSWEDALIVAEQLGYVANMALSADQVPLWDQVKQTQTLQRLQSGLTIALEVLNGSQGSAEADAKTLAKFHVNHLFRLGYEQMLEAAKPLWRVEKMLKREDDLTGALDALPHLKVWAEGLLDKHPQGRSDTGLMSPLRSLNDCQVAKEGALIIEDLVRVAKPFYTTLLEEVIQSEGDVSHWGRVGVGPLLIAAYYHEVLSPNENKLKPLSHLDAKRLHQHCFGEVGMMGSDLRDSQAEESDLPIYAPLNQEAKRKIVHWWDSKGGQSKTAPLALLRELREQMASVHFEEIELRFIPLIWHDEI